MNQPSRKRLPDRRGIGTLELVLVLPVFLVVTALMISFGVLSTWRLRGQVAARHELWQTRWPRTIEEPVPAWWQPGTVGSDAEDAYEVLNEREMNLPVARGPLPAAQVDADLLDFTRGASRGVSQITLPIPLTSQRATADISSEHVLLEGVWTYEGTKLDNNIQRRTQVLYELAKAPAALSQAYINAVVTIYNAAYQRQLVPLDREPDFARFNRGTPDFHPPLAQFCKLDVATVDATAVANLVERIAGVYTDERRVAGVPETMTRSFLSLYRGAIQDLESQLNAQPPLTGVDRARVQAQLDMLHAELDPKIKQLEAFLATF